MDQNASSVAPNNLQEEKELRIGLVLYGGVSLAIYIYGVAYEFLRLARKEDGYTDILKDLKVKPVVDVISGSSAGGINGLFLAKVLTTGASLKPLRNLWIQEGDFSKLLDTEHEDPTSLLDSDAYRQKLEDALNLIDEKDRTKHKQSVLDLFITATDLDGVVHHHEMSHLDSKYHNIVFHFKVRENYNDDIFDGKKHVNTNPFLAKVAGATSAFPVAFTPVRLTEEDQKLAKEFSGESVDDFDVFQDAVYGDGGMLDNAPFSYTTTTIFRRHANVPVDRKLVFVEPDPTEHKKRHQPAKDRDGFDSLASFIGASFYESLTADLKEIEWQNERIKEVGAMLKQVEDYVTTHVETFQSASYGDLRKQYEASVLFRSYQALKKTQIMDQFWQQAVILKLDLDKEAFYKKLNHFDQKTFFTTFDYGFRIRRLRYFIGKINALFKIKGNGTEQNPQYSNLVALKKKLYEYIGEYEHHYWEIWNEIKKQRSKYIGNGDLLVADLKDKFLVLMGDKKRDEAKTLIEDAGLKNLLPELHFFDAFEFLDMHIYPASILADVAETDLLEVFRISPRDARRYSTSVKDKLAGEKMMHFSAFLKEDWRRNDILWGRLDTAEIIVVKLLYYPVIEEVLRAFGERMAQSYPKAVQSEVLHAALDIFRTKVLDEPFGTLQENMLQDFCQQYLSDALNGCGDDELHKVFDGLCKQILEEENRFQQVLATICKEVLNDELADWAAYKAKIDDDLVFMKDKYGVGKETFDHIPEQYVVHTLSESLRTLGRLQVRLGEKVPMGFRKSARKGTRLIQWVLVAISNVLTTVGGVGKSVGIGFGALGTLLLWMTGVIDIHTYTVGGGAILALCFIALGYWGVFSGALIFFGVLTQKFGVLDFAKPLGGLFGKMNVPSAETYDFWGGVLVIVFALLVCVNAAVRNIFRKIKAAVRKIHTRKNKQKHPA